VAGTGDSSGKATGEGQEVHVPKTQTKKKPTKRASRRAPKSAATGKRAGRAAERKRKLDLNAYRGLLLAERDRIQKELEEMQARTARRSKLDSAVEEQDFDENPGDAATETLERGTDMALERTVHDILEQVEHSLEKMQDGTYGVCDSCGADIAEVRLRALPYATLCLACQDRLERG
jgi:RNA polymerase-binding transcription factor DksA